MLTKAQVLKVNKAFRAKDDSSLWPINGSFNATERAIKWVRRQCRLGLVIDDIYSYESILESRISHTVNNY